MRILLVSDSHLAPAAHPCNDNWQAVRHYAGRSGADLTLHVGDITLDGINAPAQHAWALGSCADWPTPLRFLPGNHDIGDNPSTPDNAVKDPLDLDRLYQYRDDFGSDYWVQTAGAWQVIGLNAQLFGTGVAAEAEQWAWLEDALAQAGRQPLALVLHKPLFLDDPEEASVPLIRYVPVAPRRRLLALLRRSDLRLVLSGHTHQYLDRVIAGVRHIWLPSTAFIIPDVRQTRVGEKVTGVGLLELSPEGHGFDLVVPDGVERHSLHDPVFAPLIGATH